MHLPYQEYKNPQASHRNLRFFYIVATQLVVPSAVTIAVAIDAIICTINISFFASALKTISSMD